MAAAVVVSLLLVAGAVFWAYRGSATTATNAGIGASPVPSKAPAPTVAQAMALSTQLRSGNATQVAQVVADVSTPPTFFLAGLAKLRGLTLDTTHFTYLDAATGSMPARVTIADGRTERWTVYLSYGPHGWQLVSTQRAP